MSYTPSSYPTYVGSNAIAGKKFLLYVKYSGVWNLIGGLRDTGLDITSEVIDASCVDGDDWGESIPGARSWSSNPSLVVKSSNIGDGIIENWVLDDDLQTEKPALQFAFVNSADNTYFEGWGTVTSYSTTASYNDVMTKSISINGVGKIEKKSAFSAGNTISPTSSTFSKAAAADKTFTITTVGTATVSSVQNNGTALTTTTDYTYSSGTLTIKKEYLNQQGNGDTNLKVVMDYGNAMKITITVGA